MPLFLWITHLINLSAKVIEEKRNWFCPILLSNQFEIEVQPVRAICMKQIEFLRFIKVNYLKFFPIHKFTI